MHRLRLRILAKQRALPAKTYGPVHRLPQPALSLVAALLLLVPSLVRASDDLLRLVGDDVGLCIEVNGLTDHLRQWSRSVMAERLQEVSLFRQWQAGPDYQNLQQARKTIEAVSGKRIEELATQLLGQSVVVAVYPQAEAEPAVVFLTRCQDREFLNDAVQLWNQMESQKTATQEYRGYAYFRRTKTVGTKRVEKPVYYALLDERLVVSDRDEMIRKSIDLHARTADRTEAPRPPATRAAGSLTASPKFKQARASLAPGSVASAYFNPRAWDAVMNTDWLHSTQRRGFLDVWQRFESFILGVRINEGCVVEAIAQFDPTRTSEAWKELVRQTGGSPVFLKRLPENALAAAAGRVDFRPFIEPLNNLLSQGGQKWQRIRQVGRGLLMGFDPLDDLLPALGGDWVGYVLPKEKLVPNELPLDGLIAFSWSAAGNGGPEHGRAAADMKSGLDNALRMAANVLAASFNSRVPPEPAIVRSRVEGETSLCWIENLVAYEPAYALTAHAIVLGTSAKLVRDFVQAKPHEAMRPAADLQMWSDEFFPDENHVLYVNVVETRRFLTDFQRHLDQQAEHEGSPQPSELQQHLAGLNDILQLFDAVFMASRVDESRVRLIGGGVARRAQSAQSATN